MWHPRVRPIIERWERERPPVGADDLTSFYTNHEAFRAALERELALLRTVTDHDFSQSEAREALRRWLKQYHAREESFAGLMESSFPGQSAWTMDGFETFLEGSARYVEARFLISPPQVSFDLLKGDPSFHRFEESRGKRPSQLPGLNDLEPKYFYAIGMYLCFILDVADATWKATVFDSDRLLIGAVERVAATTN
jgi:hypothetical protein